MPSPLSLVVFMKAMYREIMKDKYSCREKSTMAAESAPNLIVDRMQTTKVFEGWVTISLWVSLAVGLLVLLLHRTAGLHWNAKTPEDGAKALSTLSTACS